jgi:hypothetical protein
VYRQRLVPVMSYKRSFQPSEPAADELSQPHAPRASGTDDTGSEGQCRKSAEDRLLDGFSICLYPGINMRGARALKWAALQAI